MQLPRSTRNDGQYFVQLASGPFDIRHCLENLLRSVSSIREEASVQELEGEDAFIRQFDATRDLKGTFFCPGGMQSKYN